MTEKDLIEAVQVYTPEPGDRLVITLKETERMNMADWDRLSRSIQEWAPQVATILLPPGAKVEVVRGAESAIEVVEAKPAAVGG